ncbi:predicted protein [Uncinocarpus reesii 1704]|uniref:Uncharacterized protein n=1 Tax=Uncinocarpus reesii (strain UAMH 1704) TaxID=336963 RepID=C4JVJ4_UNCRE|nr:uncharacterized protein UREG_06586 [Uncinocarpus reesii 1704]EEP81721.1 predicted protein [Uncinocarpus reesii 1704]
MPLTVLSNRDVRSLLLSLTGDEVRELRANLAEALREYSSGNQNSGCFSEYQPKSTTISKRNGLTTMFLPASTESSLGFKIMTVADAPSKPGPQRRLSASEASIALPATLDSKSTLDSMASKLSRTALAPAATRLSQSRAASPRPAPAADQETNVTSPSGSLTLLDPTGSPFGIVNAQELTAFRTALTSMMLLYRREKISTITVFGAGRQAYWHIRLALLLRCKDIKRVNIINRSFERATGLLRKFYAADHVEWRQNVKFSAFSRDFVEYDRLLRECVVKADVIFCCTPSPDPLFPADILTDSDGRRKGRFISAIGSYRPNMTELDPDLIKHAIKSHTHHKHPPYGGVIVVDTLEASLHNAGEVVMAGLKPRQLVEVGELLMVKDATEKQGDPPDKSLVDWLQRGNVIYKCAGLGLMDLVVGGDIIKLAKERHIGTTISEF